MRIGLVELLLILAIASVTIGPKVLLFVDRWLRRARRTNAAAARRRAEYQAQMAAERDALLKRFRVATSVAGACLMLAAAYGLLLRPIDTQPQIYTANEQRSAADKQAGSVERLDLGSYKDVSCLHERDGWLYLSVRSGKKDAAIVRMQPDGSGLTPLLSLTGEITGFDFDQDGSIWFTAITEEGGALYRASYDGWGAATQLVVSQIDGKALHCPAAVAVGQDGKVYFADAAAIDAADSALATLRVELIAHTASGWVYVYDPDTLTVRRVLGGVAGADGLAISPQGDTLYVADLANRCIWAVDTAARDLTAGGRDCAVFADQLPGYPGALAVDADGNVHISYRWAGSAWLEKNAASTLLRSVALRAGTSVQAKLFALSVDVPAVEALTAQGGVQYGVAGDGQEGCTALCSVGNRIYFALAGQTELLYARV